MRLWNTLARQPQCDTLARGLASPYAVRSAAPPFLARGILASTTRGIAHDDLQIALLRREPPLDEGDGVGGHAREESVLGLGPTDRAHEKGNLLVDGLDLLQRLGTLLGANDAVEQRLKRIVERDLNIVDGGFGRLLAGLGRGRNVILVDADGILELDGRKSGKVGLDELREAGEVERVCAVEEGLELGVAGKLALVVILLEVLRARVFPDAHQHAGAVFLVGVQEFGHGLAETEDLRILVSLEVDGDVDVLVGLALELYLAEGVVLRLRALCAPPLNLLEVVRLQACGPVKIDSYRGEELRKGLRFVGSVGLLLGVVVHGVGVLLVVVLLLQTFVGSIVEQTTLDFDAVGSVCVGVEIEGIGVGATRLPGLVLGGVGDPYAHGGGAAAARVEDRVGGLELLAHHGRVEGALNVAQLLVAGDAVANADVLDALGHVLVGRVLGLATQLVATLELGILGLLHVGGGVRVLGRMLLLLLLLRGILVRMCYRGWFAEHALQVSLSDHRVLGGRRQAQWVRAQVRVLLLLRVLVLAERRYVPGPRRVGGAWCAAAWAASG